MVNEINMVSYAHNIALIADTEDGLQRLLYNFHLSCLKLIMKISIHKMKVMTISKEPICCKLEINSRMVERIMEFIYLGVNITSSGNLVKQIKT
jgi:hypothetical protein